MLAVAQSSVGARAIFVKMTMTPMLVRLSLFELSNICNALKIFVILFTDTPKDIVATANLNFCNIRCAPT